MVWIRGQANYTHGIFPTPIQKHEWGGRRPPPVGPQSKSLLPTLLAGLEDMELRVAMQKNNICSHVQEIQLRSE